VVVALPEEESLTRGRELMSEVIQGLSSVFKSPAFGPIVSGGTLALGEVGNLLAGRQQQNAYNAVTKMTPDQIARDAARTAAPLDRALTQSVTNQVSGDLASRGLSQAPGILASTESQALAPYAYQNYQAALQAVMEKLGMNLNAAQLLPKGQNLTPAMMLFLQQMAKLKQTNANSGPTLGPTTPPTFPNTTLPQGPSQFPSPPEGTVFGPPPEADLSGLGVNVG
jgi:hypothetical protein